MQAKHSLVWLQSLMLHPPAICGMQLKPYSLIHDLTLECLENPVAAGGTLTDTKLLEAVFICSRDWQGLRRDLLAMDDAKAFSFGKKAIKTIDEDRESFRVYVSEYKAIAPRSKSKSKDDACVPWQFHVARSLCGDWGFTEPQAWDMPVNRAVCYCDTKQEYDGGKSLISPYDAEMADLMAKAKAFYDAGDRDSERSCYDKVKALIAGRDS